MKCPFCNSTKSFVIKTSQVHSDKNGDGVRRLRRCAVCKRGFYTVEWVKRKGEK